MRIAPLEILNGLEKNVHVVLEEAQRAIAGVAEQPPDRAGLVVMVDGEALVEAAVVLAADRADTILPIEHFVELLAGDPVLDDAGDWSAFQGSDSKSLPVLLVVGAIALSLRLLILRSALVLVALGFDLVRILPSPLAMVIAGPLRIGCQTLSLTPVVAVLAQAASTD